MNWPWIRHWYCNNIVVEVTYIHAYNALLQVGRVTSVRMMSMVVPTLTVSWVWIVWTSLLQEWGQCVVHALQGILETGQSALVSYHPPGNCYSYVVDLHCMFWLACTPWQFLYVVYSYVHAQCVLHGWLWEYIIIQFLTSRHKTTYLIIVT